MIGPRRRSLAVFALLLFGTPALAYIEALTAMKGVLAESDVIARGAVDAVSVEKKVVILKVTKNLKGKSAYERIKVDFGAGEGWHGEAAIRHATVGSPVGVFYHKAENSDKAGIALIYLNRFFMTVHPEEGAWRLGKIELAMNRVFCGTAEELPDLVVKVLSGRVKPPAPNAQLRPFTRNILDRLPPPPKEGDPWPAFDPAQAFKLEKTFLPDSDGFLPYWLLAGPSKAPAEPPKGTPKAGDPFVGDGAWKAHQSPDPVLDLSAFASETGRDPAGSAFFGVAYLFCEQDAADLRLAVGSYGESTWWLNGEEVVSVAEPRKVVKDQAFSKPVSLRKGRNVLAVAVRFAAAPAGACARFVDKESRPFRAFANDASPR